MAALTGSDHGENINDLSTYTFAARAIGPVNSLRTVAAALMWRSANPATVNSVIIGGVTADLVAPFFTAQTWGVVAVADVPNGTTADVVLALAASCGRAACNVAYSDVLLNHAPVDTAQYLVGGGATIDLDLDIAALGVAIGMAYNANAAAAATCAWTGMVEFQDNALGESSNFHSAALVSAGALETNRNVAALWSQAGNHFGIAASFAAVPVPPATALVGRSYPKPKRGPRHGVSYDWRRRIKRDPEPVPQPEPPLLPQRPAGLAEAKGAVTLQELPALAPPQDEAIARGILTRAEAAMIAAERQRQAAKRKRMEEDEEDEAVAIAVLRYLS
jgi:hypothetical protein